MIAVFIVPTGIGAEIGGHSGDATPSLRLIAGVCDKVITHPNVVNASDINESPGNALYVEGSMLDRFLLGVICLKERTSNRILVVVNPPANPETINAVSAARAVLGCTVEVMELTTRLNMKGWVEGKGATGTSTGHHALTNQVRAYGLDKFDALAIASEITIHDGVALTYFHHGGVNPWGGVEAMVSRFVSENIGKPVAHAPVESEATKDDPDLMELAYNQAVDPRMAAEAISTCYIFSVLKGLHTAPLPSTRGHGGISRDDVGCMISPWGCWGLPHRACASAGIPVIMVRENQTVLDKTIPSTVLFASNYHEACGIVAGLAAGVSWESVRRPIKATRVIGQLTQSKA